MIIKASTYFTYLLMIIYGLCDNVIRLAHCHVKNTPSKWVGGDNSEDMQ